MSATSFKVTFKLDEEDAKYFRGRFRKAKAAAKHQDREEILRASRDLVKSVRQSKKTPNFVLTWVRGSPERAELRINQSRSLDASPYRAKIELVFNVRESRSTTGRFQTLQPAICRWDPEAGRGRLIEKGEVMET